MNLLEVCCGSLESVAAAVEGGARRIELCSALEVDGLTPLREDLRTVRKLYPDLMLSWSMSLTFLNPDPVVSA